MAEDLDHAGRLPTLAEERAPAGLDPGKTSAVLSIVGPDGAGKSTLIDALVAEGLAGAPVLRMRRPGVLYRRTIPDIVVTEPHRDPPYSQLMSLAKTAYIFVDVYLGWKLRIQPFVRRGGWVIIERGWWDIAVDPRRYRMRPHGGLLWLLGRLLPRPDLLMVLEAPPEIVYARKTELSLDELDRQMKAWRRHLPASQRRVFLDASRPARDVLEQAVTELERLASTVGPRSLGAGWTGVPKKTSARWVLPRAPRAVALSGLMVYHPVTPFSRLGWEAARAMAWLGAFRLLPAGSNPPPDVTDALAPHLGLRDTLSVARTNHPGRWVGLVLGPRGAFKAVAKVARDERGRAGLAAEVRALSELGAALEPPLRAPKVISHGDGVVLFEMSKWHPRLRPWRLPSDVAHALGRFFAAGAGPRAATGFAHGDFAPWNLLRTDTGWVVLDWEAAHRDAAVFHDLWHFLVQGHALLGHPKTEELLEALEGRGWAGRALSAYADGAGVRFEQARPALLGYLELSRATLDLTKEDGAAGLRARDALLDRLARA